MDTLPADSTRSCAGDTCSAGIPFFLHLSHHNIILVVVVFLSVYGICEAYAGRLLWKRQHNIGRSGQVR